MAENGSVLRPKDDAVVQALTGLRAEPTTVEVARLVLFDEETHRLADRIFQATDPLP
ncbi:hypothetical protein ODJ79_17130 [Actinoplanes sp. KI2]|uniref:hypothetical protein n=1 Tax=Actinoplanes sp. KI2 TaxID=2983315 RepID=UPI0021D6148E|nr:hypothetical protein [Actinoplanes sp. KI2]MCU7725452.1 hypothetical protein [Actinoplanes sp. KI2]